MRKFLPFDFTASLLIQNTLELCTYRVNAASVEGIECLGLPMRYCNGHHKPKIKSTSSGRVSSHPADFYVLNVLISPHGSADLQRGPSAIRFT